MTPFSGLFGQLPLPFRLRGFFPRFLRLPFMYGDSGVSGSLGARGEIRFSMEALVSEAFCIRTRNFSRCLV
jgi:hypothetical protein